VRVDSLKAIKGLFILALALALPVAGIIWAESKTALSPAAAAGEKLFDQNCARCHYANETRQKVGPGLKGILKNKELPYTHKPATVANVREMTASGHKFSKTEMDDLMAYLKTL
jgi:cytochrome c2